jgi:acetolactate synthase-1/3 small subunit
VVAYGEDSVVEQILKQLNKLVDVIQLANLTEDEHFEREVMLIKVSPKASQQSELSAVIKAIRARELAVDDHVMILELMDTCSRLNEAMEKLSAFNVIEVVRSGAVGISSGAAALKI